MLLLPRGTSSERNWCAIAGLVRKHGAPSGVVGVGGAERYVHLPPTARMNRATAPMRTRKAGKKKPLGGKGLYTVVAVKLKGK